MERYDFREDSEAAGSVVAEVDGLSVDQLILVHEAIADIKAKTAEDHLKQGEEWFQTAILPVLKNYAQVMGAVLDVDKMDEEVMTATLRTRSGFDISEQYRLLYAVLMAAVHISIEKVDEELLLVLAFDIRHFMHFN